MEFAPDDVVEQILVRLDVKDLIRCKSVCNSWHSIISTPSFVKAHLKRAYANDHNNPELGHRRVCNKMLWAAETWHEQNGIDIVGSCNGLLCVSPRGVKFAVTNPLTREQKKLPTPPYWLHHIRNTSNIRNEVCWGFGYDSLAYDYKVIAGFNKRGSKVTFFYSLTLKSNTWKYIGHVECWMRYGSVSGTLCGGKLYWLMKKDDAILSLDLSTEEFKEIPPHECSGKPILGVIDECLCIFIYRLRRYERGSSTEWVMKNNKWELFIDDRCQSKYDVAHHLPITMNSSYFVDDGNRVPFNGIHVRASTYVKSLVSPHPHVNDDNNDYEGQKRIVKEEAESAARSTKDNIRKRKRNQWSW
ncbi:F-box protein CPR1-like [Bidens hawaiensis]|uniref:F-box protein CPR1-like n=1 Tax=Bidens hawaiensis TaxID=980011 RepID=UPI004049A25D